MAKFFLTNPGFEFGDRDFTKGPSWSILKDTPNARSGDWVAKTITDTDDGIQNSISFAMRPGGKFTGAGWFKHTSDYDAASRIEIAWRDKDDVVLSSPDSNVIAAGTTVYTLAILTDAVAPNRTKNVIIRGRHDASTLGNLWLDDLSMSGDIIESLPTTAIISGHRMVTADTVGVFDPLIGTDKFTEFNAGMSDKWSGVYTFIPSLGADLGELVSFIRRLGRTERFFAFDPDRVVPLNGIVNDLTVNGATTQGTNKIPVLFVPPDLTLLYEFARSRSLVASRGLGPTLDFVRVGPATFFDSAGILQTAASGVARFDHDPVTGVSLGLLIEEARTNICIRSEEFNFAAWLKQIGGTGITAVVTPNAGVAPDGTTTADRLQCDLNGGTAAADISWLQQAFTGLANPHDNASSIYLKSNTGSNQQILVRAAGGTSQSTVTVTPQWQRFNEGVLAFASTTDDWTVGLQGNQVTEDVCDILIWGGQVELAAFPTSYIKTVASSVTRNADEVSTTDVSWANANFGTFFANVRQPFLDTSALVFSLSGATPFTDFIRTLTSAGKISTEVVNSADTDGSILDPDALVANVAKRFAMAYADDDMATSFDGAAALTDATVGVPLSAAFAKFAVGARARVTPDVQWNGHIAEIRYYNVRKDNQFLEDLSNGIITVAPANSPALVAGDYMEVKDQYFQLQRDFEIGPEGTGEAIVFPAVRSTFADGEDVITDNPKMVARITSDLDWRRIEARPVDLSISWEEV